MSQFDAYSRYYDLLYSDKDYASEAEYIRGLIQQHAPGSSTILELGCGTCGHAIHLAKRGFKIECIDNSEVMIERARHNLTALSSETRNRIRLGRADIRTARLPRQFDVVVSLFHVMSYLPENNDLVAAFKTAATHLVPGGLFIFDCWYGPAVLAERPSLRVKRIENHNTKIVRIAEPEIRPNLNIVKVHYQVWVKDRHTKSLHEIRETHTMRYWFKPEVSEALTQTGFELRTFNEFMTAKEPGLDTWNVIFVARC